MSDDGARVEAIESRTVTVPLPRPVGFSTRRVNQRTYLLVRVHTADGRTGIGFCYEGHKATGLAAMAVRELLSPVVVGRSAYGTAGLWAEMYQEALLHGRSGVVMRALSAIDIALWDRNARAVGLPLSEYLGATESASVPAYASGGYYLDGGDPVELVRDEVNRHVAAGFNAVKLKVGGAALATDTARVAAAREILGPDRLLLLDANNAFTSVADAVRAVRRFEPYDPYLIEEPFGPDDVESHRRLAARTDVAIATGEIESGRWRNGDLLMRDAAEILQVDATVCGGITEFRVIAAIAAAVGKQVWPHWFHELHVHLAASIPNCACVEFFSDATVFNFRQLVQPPIESATGRLRLPTGAGLGFDLDANAVDRYAIDRWRGRSR